MPNSDQILEFIAVGGICVMIAIMVAVMIVAIVYTFFLNFWVGLGILIFVVWVHFMFWYIHIR